VIDHANGRVPVVIHVGGQRVKEVITLARHASAAGADGIAVIPPYYYNMDDMALEQYFSLIAETVSGIPIYLYNIPSNAKNTIKTSLFARLAEKYPHIIGMKESSMDFANFYDLVQVAKANHVTLMGNDAQILPALAVGGTGAVSAGSTAVPEPYVHLYQAFQKGDLEEARKWQAVCAQVKKMLAKSYPIAPHKKVLELRGVIKAIQSPPLRSMNEAETEELKRNLTELGYLH
jgi:dihydrodipicolinate synthase/N-acetylneuraminate lyase